MIFACIEKALESLGDSAASSILFQIENKYHFPRDEFASRPLDFIRYLREFLGASGSAVIEKMVIREIISAFKLNLPPRDTTFEKGLEEARKSFLTS